MVRDSVNGSHKPPLSSPIFEVMAIGHYIGFQTINTHGPRALPLDALCKDLTRSLCPSIPAYSSQPDLICLVLFYFIISKVKRKSTGYILIFSRYSRPVSTPTKHRPAKLPELHSQIGRLPTALCTMQDPGVRVRDGFRAHAVPFASTWAV